MFSFLSLPKPSLRSQPRLILYKALFWPLIIAICLILLAARPALAQNPPGYWGTQPCDANGNSSPFGSYQDPDGYYTMSGSENVTVTNGYPPILLEAAIADPYAYSTYIQAGSPLWPILDGPATSVFCDNGLGSASDNPPVGANSANYTHGFWGGTAWYYDIYLNGAYNRGLLNGSVNVNITGTLTSYFKLVWQSGSSSTPTTPRPDHLDLLMEATLLAGTYVDSGGSSEITGLWARSLATDGPPFYDIAASASGVDRNGAAVTVSGNSTVTKYHLVRSPVGLHPKSETTS